MTPAQAQAKVIDLTDLPDHDVAVVCTLVETLRQQAAMQPPASYEEWRQRFDGYLHEVATRADRYPAGFVLDDSRETIYEGRGE
jgi:hypothetical protein